MNSDTKQKNQIMWLCIIGIFVLGYLFYMYLYKPIRADIEQAQTEMEAKENVISTKITAIEGYEANKEKIVTLRQAAQEEAKRFYIEQEQEDYLLIFMNLVNAANLSFKSGSATENTPYEPNYENYECTNPNVAFEGKEDKAPEIVWMPINISVEGRYVNMLNFLAQLKNNEKYIMCDSANLKTSGEGNEGSKDPNMSASYTLRFVRIMEIGGLLDTGELPDIQETPLPAGFIEEFKSGSYKSQFSLSNISDYIVEMISSITG